MAGVEDGCPLQRLELPRPVATARCRLGRVVLAFELDARASGEELQGAPEVQGFALADEVEQVAAGLAAEAVKQLSVHVDAQ